MTANTRKQAFECLLNYEKNKNRTNFLKQTLDKADKSNISEVRDKSFIKLLVTGVLKQSSVLDCYIKKYSKIPFHKIKTPVIVILRMCVYQLMFMRTEDYAAINEAVSLTKSVGLSGLAPYVNAVLRKISQDNPNKITGDTDIKNSEMNMNPYPEWFHTLLCQQYDVHTIERMIASFSEKPELTIRVNDMTQVSTIKNDCARLGMTMTEHVYLQEAFHLKNAHDIRNVPGFADGLISVQDISGMLAVKCAGILKGDVIADVCAAPGSKAMYAAQLTGKYGKVYAFDKNAKKTEKIKENAKRLKINNIDIQVADVSEYDFRQSKLWGCCDVLLCDLPCSGLGVIGKKPDIIKNTDLEKIASLIALQRKILSNVAGLLKAGGTLLYSTCTINKCENIENIEWMIQQFGFRMRPIDEYLPKELKSDTTAKGFLELLQGVHKSDGAFIAALTSGYADEPN